MGKCCGDVWGGKGVGKCVGCWGVGGGKENVKGVKNCGKRCGECMG